MEDTGASVINGYTWIKNVPEGVTVLICNESALAHYGIGSFNQFEFMQVQSSGGICGIYRSIIVDSISFDYTEYLVDNIYVVRPERAICDLILNDADLFHLLEAIDDCFNYDNCIPDGFDRELCLKLIRENGIEDRFNELLEESKTIYDE